MKREVNNIIRVPTSLSKEFFRLWLEFLTPFHSLSPREMDVATAFIQHRFELSSSISDVTLLDQIAMNEDSKRKVRNECGLSEAHFQVIMSKLRKNKVIKDGKLNSKFIPKSLNKEDSDFKLLLYFDFNG